MIITAALEAARYKGQLPDVKRFLSHSFDTMTDRPLCNRVQDLSTSDPAHHNDAPTCHRCYAKDPRFGNPRGLKLTLEQVSEIRRRLANGETASKLCIEFGVTLGHISNIGHGRTMPAYRPQIDAIGAKRGHRR